MKAILKNPYFQIGLIIKLVAVAMIVPWVQSHWFTYFIRDAIIFPSFDPWTDFLTRGGNKESFPYGPIMFLMHLPFVAGGALIDKLSGFSGVFAQIGFSSSLLAADIALLYILCNLADRQDKKIILFYWLSPAVFYITFWHGQTDIVPVLLIMLSLLMLKRQRIDLSGVSLALSVGAKLSSIILLPFMLLFLWKNKRYVTTLPAFILYFTFTLLITFIIPLVISGGMQEMLLASPQIQKIYDISIPIGNGRIYIVPFLYILLIFFAWRIGRMNIELLQAYLGTSFFLILLLTPASAGWFFWIMPFLALYQLKASRMLNVIVYTFMLTFIAYYLLLSTGSSIPTLAFIAERPMIEELPFFEEKYLSILLSLLTALGFIISISILRPAILRNDFFHLSRKPLAIGISGDSGTGKDTLSNAIAGLFGENSVVSVSGDDYHLFERKDLRWERITHLNPQANNLSNFVHDSLSLLDGKAILCRHYNHKTGLFTQRRLVRARDLIIISGLHVLYAVGLRERLNLKIFLNMDPKLQRFFKLRRDIYERGADRKKVLATIEKRKPDFESYVATQKKHADICFGLEAVKPSVLTEKNFAKHIPLRLKVEMQGSMPYIELHRMLTSVGGLKVDIRLIQDSDLIEMLIEGDEIRASDIEQIARTMAPQINEVLALNPSWQGGMTGLMQLLVLLELTKKNRR